MFRQIVREDFIISMLSVYPGEVLTNVCYWAISHEYKQEMEIIQL